jgi:hypothetical protein
MPRKPRFKGFDYTELLTAWGLPMSEDGVDDVADLKTINEHIINSFSYGTNELKPEIEEDMLKYLDAMVKTGFSGYIPVYRAMKKLDDFEFVQVYIAMLPHMWT